MSGLFDQVVNYSPPLLTAGQVNYDGTWNASTNTPTLINPPDALSKGDYYVVSVAGTQFSLSFAVGDWIISNGTAWEKVDLTDAVSSVFGRTGAVVGVSTDYSGVGITNTAIGASSPSTGAFTTVTASSTISATGAVTGSNLSGTNTGDQTNITGNAGTATALQTARAINGVNFDGTAAITVTAAGSTLSDTVTIAKGGTGQITAQAALNALLPSQAGASGKNLQSDGTNVSFVSDAGGTVTSVAATVPSVLSISGSPITGAGTLAITYSGTALPVANGGTGVTTSTGTTNVVLSNSPTLVTPNLGTPSAIVLTNASGTASININGTVGATTPSTVAATSGTFSGQITSTIDGAKYLSRTGTSIIQQFQEVGNTGGNYQLGVERSTGGALVVGGSPYATVLTTTGATNIEFGVNLQKVAALTSTGLNSCAIGATTPSTIAATTGVFSGTGAFNGATNTHGLNVRGATGFNLQVRSVSSALTLQAANNADTASVAMNFLASSFVFIDDALVARATITSTGLNSTAIGATTPSTGAFTTLSATGTATFNSSGSSATFTGSDPDQGFTMISTATGGRSYGFKVAGSASGNIPGAGLYFYDNTGAGIVMGFDTAKKVNIYNGLAVTGALSSTTGANFATSSGSVGIGTASPTGKLHISQSGASTSLVIDGIENPIFAARYAANADASTIFLAKSRNATVGSHTIVQNGDQIGAIQVRGSNGTNFVDAASIVFSVDGTPGAGNDMPGRIVFNTTPDGSGSLTERMRIDSSGKLLVGTTSTGSYLDGNISIVASSTNPSLCAKNDPASAAPEQLVMSAWAPYSTGNNNFLVFLTETSPTQRGGISYNRSAGLVAYNTTSDYRAKDISGPVVNSGSLIDSIPVYMGKIKGATLERPMFIAHETPAYAHTGEKDAVDAEGKPIYQQMDASTLVPVLWAELQSVRARLAALESK